MGTPARWLYLLSLAICVLTRVTLVANTDPKELYTRWSTASDAAVYDRFGANLAREGVFGVGERSSGFALPAYPLLLAAIYRVAGHSPGAARWIQVVLSVLTVIALGKLARCLGGWRSEILATLGGAAYPFFLYFVPEILTECLFLFAFSGMLLTAVRAGKTGSLKDGILHGACLALGVMTRPIALAVEPGVLLLACPWRREHRGRRLGGLLLGLGILGAVWGAWIGRNGAVFGETVLLDTHGGFAFYVGQLYSRGLTSEEVEERVGYNHGDVERGILPGGPRGELEASRRSAARARKMIREDPAAFLATLPRNTFQLWLGLDFSDVSRRGGRLGFLTLAGWLSYVPLLLLGLAGLWRAWRERPWEIFGASCWILLVTSVLHAVVLGGKRYRVATIDPVLLVLAAWQGDGLIQSWRQRLGINRR